MPDTATDHPGAARVREESAAARGDGSTGSAALASRPAPSPSRVVEMMDRAVARVLHVQPQRAVATASRRPLETLLLLAGVRCTARYVVLPLALPLLGAATGATPSVLTRAALGILLILDVIAAISIIATLRRLWRVQHPRRWQYLPVALALAVLLCFFFVSDAGVLYG
jgi:hypothetical protein